MTDPASLAGLVEATGSAWSLDVNRARLLVTAARELRLPRAEADNLFQLADGPDMAAVFSRGNYSGDGLLQGDQFTLVHYSATGTRKQAAGFVEQLPAAGTNLVQSVTAALKGGTAVEPAEGYLRAESLSPERRQAIESRGQAQFQALNSIDTRHRGALARAITRPPVFSALTRSDFAALVDFYGTARQAYVTHEAAAFEITLFEGRS